MFTCQAEWVSSVFTFGYIGVLQGHLLIVANFYIFLTVFGSFLTTGYHFRNLLLGSVFPHIITIICISKKINGICITMKKLSHSPTFRKINIWKVHQVIHWAFIQIWWNIVSRICFWRNLSIGLLLWSSLQTTEKGQMRSEFRIVGLENS